MAITLDVRRYSFVFSGFSALLMHADNIDGSDELKAWRGNSKNKGLSVPGDDRTPPWTWRTYLYVDDDSTSPTCGKIVLPAMNVMRGLRQAGAQMTLKGAKTYKEISQSGILVTTENCKFTYAKGRELNYQDVLDMQDETYMDQCVRAKELGFELMKRPVNVNGKRHIRVRAKFTEWTVSGTADVNKPELTHDILTNLFALAGRGGFGDWRPACKSPGQYGQADASIKLLKD